MKKQLLRVLALCLVLILLPAAGCSREQESTGAGYLFTAVLPGDPACLDPQYTDNRNAQAVLANTMEGLVRTDASGTVVPAGAEEWTVSEDGRSYLFTLRDCKWYGIGIKAETAPPVTAQDYVYAFRRLMKPETRAPHAEDFLCIKNAAGVLAGVRSPEELGVSAPDDHTVLFELETPDARFLSLLTQSCAVPCSERFFLSTKGRYGLDPENTLSNGPFYPAQWNYDDYGSGNFISLKRNAAYYDPDSIYPSSLLLYIMHSAAEANQSFAEGGADVLLTQTAPDAFIRSGNATIEARSAATLGLIFNPDNELLQNKSLRQALISGIDRSALAPLLSDDLTVAYGIIPPAVTLLGRSYRELYADEPLSPYDPAGACNSFEAASEEVGLGSMNTVQILVSTDITDTDALLEICQNWQNLFGYYIGIETVTPADFERRVAAGEYSIALHTLSSHEGSCTAFFQAAAQDAPLWGMDAAALNTNVKALTSAREPADTVALCGSTEEMILASGCFVPLFYKNSYLLCTENNQDVVFDPFSGAVSFREAKHFE